ncbi:MAG: hypothetical protein WAO02_07495 [Verrucomicrobiia bacterium]
MNSRISLKGRGPDDGWFIPARTLLDARLFHPPSNVAGKKIKTGRQESLQMGRVVKKVFAKEYEDSVDSVAKPQPLAESEIIEAPSES